MCTLALTCREENQRSQVCILHVVNSQFLKPLYQLLQAHYVVDHPFHTISTELA